MKFSVLEIIKKDDSVDNKARAISDSINNKLLEAISKNKIRTDIIVFTLLFASSLPNTEIFRNTIKEDNGDLKVGTYNNINVFVSEGIKVGDIYIV